MQDGRMWLTLCTALSCWISWRGTWPMLCWVSWQRTSLYRSVSCCTASRTHSSHCLSRQESLRNKSGQTGREKEDREIGGRKNTGTDRFIVTLGWQTKCQPSERQRQRKTPLRPLWATQKIWDARRQSQRDSSSSQRPTRESLSRKRDCESIRK